MLYELWRRVAAARRDEFALRDITSGRSWSFGELFAAGEGARGGRPALPPDEMVFPQGHTPEFILELLAAWRDGSIVCPLEPGQPPPVLPLPPPPCVHLKLTSATTGGARMVAFTAAQLAADAENIVATMGLRPDWPNLGVISLAHSYGFSNLVLPLLLHGVPLVLGTAPLPEAVRRASDGFAALTLPAVPAMWRAWHEAGAIPPNVRLAISAGAPLPAALEQAVFAASGLKIHNFYGSTECGGIAYDAGEMPREDDAFIGAPMRDVALSTGATGCLVVRSRAVGESYWPEPAPSLGGRVFETSDLVELAEEKVFLRGRASDLINVAGRKVWPAAIEGPLRGHPAVAECIVFGVDSDTASHGEQIVAALVPRAAVTAGELKQFLLERIPAWQVPREWLWVDRLSSHQLGKISRVEWRRRFLSGWRGDQPGHHELR